MGLDTVMNIVIAPDSFKGSLTSTEVSNVISKAFTEEIPDSIICAVPMADGGEGTIDSMVFSTKGIKKEIEATGPLLLRCKTYYGVLGDGKTVVIEVASICGITMLQPFEKNPFLTSTYGVGEVIKYALEQGYRQFIIGLGGSATNDGGLGMLQALGATFKDKYGQKINPIGNSLPEIKFIDFSTLDQRIYESDIKVASDVENPLCGKNGASFVFGPQKGATREQIEMLDNALFNYANLVERELSKSMKDTPGAGAAGGLGFAFLAIGAELV
jgi:glycerate kinase